MAFNKAYLALSANQAAVTRLNDFRSCAVRDRNSVRARPCASNFESAADRCISLSHLKLEFCLIPKRSSGPGQAQIHGRGEDPSGNLRTASSGGLSSNTVNFLKEVLDFVEGQGVGYRRRLTMVG